MSTAARKIRLLMELRGGGIADTDVLAAIERIPRERFVPPSFQDQAYENTALPIGQGQTLSQPAVVALMTQALQPDRSLKVLEVGTGSGYQAAVLSRLFRRVYTIEQSAPLLKEAERRFADLRLHNITCRHGDGALGWPEQAPFARMIVTAAAGDIPAGLVDQLGPEGLLVVPIGPRNRPQRLIRVTRQAQGFAEEDLGAVRFVPLLSGAAEAARSAGVAS